MAPRNLHIAVFDCDTPVPNVYREQGMYSDIFEELLRDVQGEYEEMREVELRFSRWNCVKGERPTQVELEDIDGVIITGSAASAYDDDAWVKELTEYTRDIYNNHPKIHLFGSCFGHQLLCSSLFSTPLSPVVHPDPKGWELGIHPISLTDAFLSHYGPVSSNVSSPTELRLQFVHADHVVLHPMPVGFHAIGSTEHCALQGIWRKGRVLTYQGHAEFGTFVNRETIKVFRRRDWSEMYFQEAMGRTEKVDDRRWAAGVMLKFFLEDEMSAEEVAREVAVETEEDDEVLARL